MTWKTHIWYNFELMDKKKHNTRGTALRSSNRLGMRRSRSCGPIHWVLEGRFDETAIWWRAWMRRRQHYKNTSLYNDRVRYLPHMKGNCRWVRRSCPSDWTSLLSRQHWTAKTDIDGCWYGAYLWTEQGHFRGKIYCALSVMFGGSSMSSRDLWDICWTTVGIFLFQINAPLFCLQPLDNQAHQQSYNIACYIQREFVRVTSRLDGFSSSLMHLLFLDSVQKNIFDGISGMSGIRPSVVVWVSNIHPNKER